MKVPKIFVPDKGLENKIKDYLETRVIHEDPNLIYIRSFIKASMALSGEKARAPFDILSLKPFDEAYKELKRTAKVCIRTTDFFKILEETPYTYRLQRENMLSVFLNAQEEYKKRIKDHINIAVLGDESVLQKGVMDYVWMIIGMDAESRQGNSWEYMDPQTKKRKTIIINESYIQNVEENVGLKNPEQKESFRRTLIKIYGMTIPTNPGYDFMDNLELVRAVIDVRLKSDIAGAGSLIGPLANRTNEENCKLYNQVIDYMIKNLKYCKVCAEKTLEYFCTPQHL